MPSSIPAGEVSDTGGNFVLESPPKQILLKSAESLCIPITKLTLSRHSHGKLLHGIFVDGTRT